MPTNLGKFMYRLIYALAWSAITVGLSVFAIALGFILWLWCTEVIPYFWARGNPWPVLISLATVLLVVGVGVGAAVEDKVRR